MKAVEIDAFGGIEVLQVRDVPEPQPAENEVLVKLAFAGVNYTDVYRRNGDYARSPTYPTPLPARIGVDGSGVVTAVGRAVSHLGVGDRVAFTRIQGSYAEIAAVPEAVVMPVPERLGLDVAAALITQGTTAHYLATSAWPLEPGHSCLIHAGAGGVGQFLIQIAKIRDARVFTTVGSAEKAEIARARGADQAILYREVNFRESIMAATEDAGVDVVYDSVGKATFHRLHPLPAAAGSLCPVRPRLGKNRKPQPSRPVGGGLDLLHPPAHGPLYPHTRRAGRPLAGPHRVDPRRPAHRDHRSRAAPRPGGRGPPRHGSARIARQAPARGGR